MLEHQFKEKGYQVTEEVANADLAILNTCSVTAKAEQEARYLLRRYRRANPACISVVTGCYAQISSSTLLEREEVDYVIPNEAKPRLTELLCGNDPASNFVDKMPKGVRPVKDNRQNHFKSSVTFFDHPRSSRTRAYLKIQDGCNGFCSYCQIPYARGASRSVPPHEIIAKIKALLLEGTQEIVFTGIHLGDYGRDIDLGVNGFADLLRKIFECSPLPRFRISSLEPMELSPDLLDVLKEHRQEFCDHFHLPLQSGSDRILKLMRRQYNTSQYSRTVDMIRDAFPNAHVSADIIPGFPQETLQDHEETLAFIASCGLASLHVFPYSKRPNTLAEKLPGHLDATIVKERARELRQLSSRLKSTFYQSQVGSRCAVLWESEEDALGRRIGKTSNYLDVAAGRGLKATPGSITTAVLKGFCDDATLLAVPL